MEHKSYLIVSGVVAGVLALDIIGKSVLAPSRPQVSPTNPSAVESMVETEESLEFMKYYDGF